MPGPGCTPRPGCQGCPGRAVLRGVAACLLRLGCWLPARPGLSSMGINYFSTLNNYFFTHTSRAGMGEKIFRMEKIINACGLACLSGRLPVLADWLPACRAWAILRPGLLFTVRLPGLPGPRCPPWAMGWLSASPGLLAARPARAVLHGD